MIGAEGLQKEQMSYERLNESDEERILRRRRRIAEMKRRKRRAELMQKRVIPAVGMLVLVVFLVTCVGSLTHSRAEEPESDMPGQSQASEDGEEHAGVVSDGTDDGLSEEPGGDLPVEGPAVAAENEIYGPVLPEPELPVFTAAENAGTVGFGADIGSEYGVVIDVEKGAVLAQRNAWTRMYPASMTKVLTILTAAEALGIKGENWNKLSVLDKKFAITIEITDYSFVNECSNVGFEVGEEVSVRDLFYGTVLPSGADAALGLAFYTAGSQEAFVELMNRKLEELGLSESTHFTNCIGLYDKDHYSTAYDMAVILKSAADNPFCREVLSAHTHTIAPTEQHPEGMVMSNWFLRSIEEEDTGGEVLCGKTGYVVKSKHCAASLAVDGEGREYICVTAGVSGKSACIRDHAALYRAWMQGE